MKNLRNALFLSVAVLMASPVVHASQDEDAARASIFAPVQAAYEFYQVEVRRGQNQVDAIEDELRDPELSAERKQTLRVALAALRARQAAAYERLQAESALAQLKMIDWSATR